MEREILFRGKRVDYGCWVEGFLVVNFWGRKEYTIHKADGSGCCDVRKETVGQYTGLIDKNGVKVFEGDILAYYGVSGCATYSEVKYGEFGGYCSTGGGTYGWYLAGEFGDIRDLNPDIPDFYNHIEVVGNIHDSPELLEG